MTGVTFDQLIFALWLCIFPRTTEVSYEARHAGSDLYSRGVPPRGTDRLWLWIHGSGPKRGKPDLNQVFSISELEADSCYEEGGDPKEKWALVANYGSNFEFSTQDVCKIRHVSDVLPGSLVLHGESLFISYPDRTNRGHIRFYNIEKEKGSHADALGIVGTFEAWRLVIRSKSGSPREHFSINFNSRADLASSPAT